MQKCSPIIRTYIISIASFLLLFTPLPNFFIFVQNVKLFWLFFFQKYFSECYPHSSRYQIFYHQFIPVFSHSFYFSISFSIFLTLIFHISTWHFHENHNSLNSPFSSLCDIIVIEVKQHESVKVSYNPMANALLYY